MIMPASSKSRNISNSYTVNDYKEKPLFKQLFNYIMEFVQEVECEEYNG